MGQEGGRVAEVGEMEGKEEEVKGKLMSAQRPSSHDKLPALTHRGCHNDQKQGHKDCLE